MGNAPVPEDPLETPSSPVHPVKQERSRATRERLLAVVAQLVDEGRFEDATVADIVAMADSSVGAFYGRFKNKSGALYQFYDERCTGLEAKVESLLAGHEALPLQEVMRQLVRTLVQHTFHNRQFLLASHRRFIEGDNAIVQRARAMNGRVRGALVRVLEARRESLHHDDPETAALFVLLLIGAITRDVSQIGGRVSGGSMSRAIFQQECERAVLAYLGLPH